ncbi:hypothetical protein LINPERPRIM_LOCUS8594 [Linum perenne]
MEKPAPRRPNSSNTNNNNNNKTMRQQRSPAAVWDCESNLYDSFELRSFEKQLSSAITSRTLSMPHLSSDRVRVAPAPPPSSKTGDDPLPKKKINNNNISSKFSKSVTRFLKSVFILRPNTNHHRQNKESSKDKNGGAYLRVKERAAGDQEYRYVVYDKSGALTTIPEGPESDFRFSPDINSLVRKTASERFTAARPPIAGYGI